MDKLKQQRSLEHDTANNSPVLDSNTAKHLSGDAYLIQDNGNHYAGRHYIIDFWGMDNLKDVTFIENALRNAAIAAKATLLHIHLHEFSGGGITGVALLAESHISIHTWPEHDYAAFDIFMCGQSEAEKAVDLLRDAFSPNKHNINEMLRGRID